MQAAEFLSKKAFQLFTDWAVAAAAAQSNLALTLKDYDLIVADLHKAIADAVVGLKAAGKVKKRLKPGYDYGFFCGFVQGTLNTHWHHEYIYKSSNDFKTFTAIVALSNFVKSDELANLKLDNLYRLHYEEAVNFEHTAEASRLNLPGNLYIAGAAGSTSSVFVALDAIKEGIVNKIFVSQVPDYLATVSNYFSEEDVTNILYSGSNMY